MADDKVPVPTGEALATGAPTAIDAATKAYVDTVSVNDTKIATDVSFDLNTITGVSPGPYTKYIGTHQITNQVAGLNFPSGVNNGFVLSGYSANAGWHTQLFMGVSQGLGVNGVPRLYYRASYNQGTYSNWHRVFTSAGGTVTGATTFSGGLTTTTFNASGAASFTGTVTLAADPTLPLQAATKQYVDAAIEELRGTITPEPPEGQASPDGTTATQPGKVLTSAGRNTFELCTMTDPAQNFGVKFNGVLDAATHHAVKLYAKAGAIYQQAGVEWYVSTDVPGGWDWTQDPTQPAVPILPPIEPPEPIHRPEPPAEGYGPNLFGCYTQSPGGETWNFGNGHDEALLHGIAIFESESGHVVNAYDYFPTWGDQNWWAANLKNMLAAAANYPKGRTLMPIIGIKMFWANTEPQNYGWNDPRGFTDNINGMWDHVWAGMVDACADTGFTTAIFRISYEHNFSFMCDSPGWDAGAQQLWKQAFEHISAVIRAQAQARGIVGLIAFNPTLGGGSQPVENFAPNPASYDICSTDAYNGFYPPDGMGSDQAARDDFWSNTYYGMTHHLNLAKAANRPVMFPEIGAGDRPDGHGKNNDVDFWHWVENSAVKAVRDAGLPMQGLMYWDVPAGDITARFSNGAQPPCMGAVETHTASDAFVGDPLWTPETMAAGVQVTAPPSDGRFFPLTHPPTTPMEVNPATFHGRDPRAFIEWIKEFRERLEEYRESTLAPVVVAAGDHPLRRPGRK
jgi:hypothetical protein